MARNYRGVALDSNGRPTTDPGAALEGTILPFGGVKGSELATVVEVLASGRVGAAMGTDVAGTYYTEDPYTKGDLFLVLDPDALGVPEFDERASEFLADLTAGESATHTEETRLPGQRSIERARSATTVETEDDLWTTVLELGET